MNAQTLLDHVDLFAEAPSGVAKLRQLILQLAVRGKLVQQDPKDGVAGTGLKELRSPDNEPYPIPENWKWTTLRSVSKELGQKVPDAPFTYIDVSAIDSERGVVGEQVQILGPSNAPSRARKLVDVGTVIYSTVRPYLLNIAVVDREFDPAPIVSTAFFVMCPVKCVASRFLFHYLRSDSFTAFVQGAMTGMAYPAINAAKMSVAPFPLPPLAEQKRIVARVDELMKRCDDLEERQKDRNERRTALTASCLHAVTTAPPKCAASEIRRVLDSFPLLIDTPESVAELRKTILQLAVKGRLVNHNSMDEPAAELLTRLAAETSVSLDGRPVRPQVSLPPVKYSAHPYELPKGWEWAHFGHVARIASNLVRPEHYASMPHVAPNNIEKDSGRLLECASVAEDNVKSGNHHFFPGQILYSKIRPNLNKVAIAPFEGLCSADMYPIDPLICPDYLARYMLSSTFLSMSVREDTRVAMPKINQEKLNVILVAVPPLSEQKRIVARIDELMSLCDILEAKLNQSHADADRLAAAIVHHLDSGGIYRKGVAP